MKFFTKIGFLFLLLQGNAALAAGDAFTQSQFDSLQSAGQPVVVHVHAAWCGSCKAQDVILSKVMGLPEFKKVTFLQVNFDDQKEALKQFNASKQSTLIVFKEGQEQGRSIGDTHGDSVESLVRKGL